MRCLLPLLTCLSAAALEPGAALPGLGKVQWVQEAPALGLVNAWLVWKDEDGGEACLEAATRSAELLAGRGSVRVLCLGSSEQARVALAKGEGTPPPVGLGAIDAAAAGAWGGAEEDWPRAVLADGQGTTLWTGPLHRLEGILLRVQSGSLDIAKLAQVGSLQREYERLTQASETAAALACLERILAIDPLYEDAIRDHLDLARSQQDAEAFKTAMAAVPVGRISPALANDLAWARLTDEDLSFRCVETAFALARRAVTAEPGKGLYLDTYARALFNLGLLDEALAVQRRAVLVTPDDDDLTTALDYYVDLVALRDRIKGRGALLPDAVAPAPALPDAAPVPAPAPAAIP